VRGHIPPWSRVAACGASRRGLIKMVPQLPPGAFSDFFGKMNALRKSFPEMSWFPLRNLLRFSFSSPFLKYTFFLSLHCDYIIY
jgi:hypothetical protein